MPARPFAKKVVQTLKEAGHIAYFAGGWVRDYLMKHPSDDIDIATSASVDEICALFPKTIPVGISFGIVIVVQEGHHFEVATFRKDRDYVDGRRPTGFDPATPEEDAQRRDFTINGMFYDPLTEKLYDYVGGQEDLKRKIIRAIGNPHERFLEDRLRMMRAVRYSTRFDFPIEEATLQAIKDHSESLLPAVAIERIWQEFCKMSQFAHFDKGLLILHQLHILPTIFPQLKNVSSHEIEKRLKAIDNFPKQVPPISELLELFPGCSLDELVELCNYLKLSRKDRDFVQFYHHATSLFAMPEDWQEKIEPIEWAHFYASSFSQICIEIVAAHFTDVKKAAFLQEHERRQETLSSHIERIRSKKPLVRAEHLMEAGITSGKKMGELLSEAERISVNQNIDDKSKVIEILKNSPLWTTK